MSSLRNLVSKNAVGAAVFALIALWLAFLVPSIEIAWVVALIRAERSGPSPMSNGGRSTT